MIGFPRTVHRTVSIVTSSVFFDQNVSSLLAD